MPTSRSWPYKPALYTTSIVYIAIQIGFLSFLSSYYDYGIRNVTVWVIDTLDESEYFHDHLNSIRDWVDAAQQSTKSAFSKKTRGSVEDNSSPIDAEIFPPEILHQVKMSDGKIIFNQDQLALFDGSRESRPVYLAILGRVYDVDKGKKHYGKGGGYSFFAGKDASRAFVSGDFTPTGLIDDLDGLSHDDLLGIRDWVSFYEKDYKLVGVVTGRYYDVKGSPTDELQQVLARMEVAAEWRANKAAEAEVFPPCNSEWKKESGGRVWCTAKSGGIHREWVGVPRIYEDPGTKSARCACVKNFGPGLSNAAQKGANRGDLDHPSLRLYPGCSSTSMSCKVEDD